jgi:hypothetical protein
VAILEKGHQIQNLVYFPINEVITYFAGDATLTTKVSNGIILTKKISLIFKVYIIDNKHFIWTHKGMLN